MNKRYNLKKMGIILGLIIILFSLIILTSCSKEEYSSSEQGNLKAPVIYYPPKIDLEAKYYLEFEKEINIKYGLNNTELLAHQFTINISCIRWVNGSDCNNPEYWGLRYLNKINLKAGENISNDLFLKTNKELLIPQESLWKIEVLKEDNSIYETRHFFIILTE